MDGLGTAAVAALEIHTCLHIDTNSVSMNEDIEEGDGFALRATRDVLGSSPNFDPLLADKAAASGV